MVAHTVAADCSQAFAEGSHDEIHTILYPGLLCTAAAIVAENSQRMCLIHQEIGAIFIFDRRNLRQRCAVPQHAVDTFHQDEGVLCPISQSLQPFL